MKSYLKSLIGCLGLLLLLPACKNESDVEEATIDVSTQLMTFTKEGGEQTLTVKTNKDTWTAFTTQESWLTLTQEGNALKVKASANDRGVDRSASIIVNAGGAQRRVAVTQSAADGLIEMTDTSVLFPKAGATKKVTFSSNGGAVKAELATPADWLTIDRVADGKPREVSSPCEGPPDRRHDSHRNRSYPRRLGTVCPAYPEVPRFAGYCDERRNSSW